MYFRPVHSAFSGNAICLLCFLLYTQNLKVLKYVGDDKKAEWARYWIERGLQG